MRLKVKAPLSAAIAIAVGLVVLLGYFIKSDLLLSIRVIFLRWGVILAAVALLVGFFNLASVHWRKVTTRQKGALYSVVLLLSLFITVVVAGRFGPTSTFSMWIFNYIQVPIESSLMAILAVILVYASARIFRKRINSFSLIFIGTFLVILVGTASLPGLEIPGFHEFRSWIAQIPAAAGARGVLLGVALGTIATGLRVLMGADRPYGG